MSMSHDETIAVIEHHKNGGDVEYFCRIDKKWESIDCPAWNFYDTKYRIKPLVLWAVYVGSKIDRSFEHEESARNHFDGLAITATKKLTLKKFVEVAE